MWYKLTRFFKPKPPEILFPRSTHPIQCALYSYLSIVIPRSNFSDTRRDVIVEEDGTLIFNDDVNQGMFASWLVAFGYGADYNTDLIANK